MKAILFMAVTLLATACGSETTSKPKDDPGKITSTEGVSQMDLGSCSSSGSSSTMTCSNGQAISLPPAFPYSKDCNKCLTKIENSVAKVKCPNGLTFEYVLLKGDKGDKGDTGSKGDKGTSCSVTTDGWVKCTDGTSYKLQAGPKGDKGETGTKGDKGDKGVAGSSCSVKQNDLGQAVISCTDGTTEVLSGCGGGGCWSFGAKGNVYRLPSNTSSLPDFTPMTPVATAVASRFDVPDRDWSLGMPYTYSPAFPDKEWYGIRFGGFVEVGPAPSDKVCFRLTSDDGSRFSIGAALIEVIAQPSLQAPTAKTGCIALQPGWHKYRLDWFQGPRTQNALMLEVSYDGGTTYRLVDQDELKFLN